jgi:predicted MFS family arabinose efflux permease
MMLLLGTAMFAVFFFLTIYIQTVWGYSPVKAGVAWVPFPITIIVVSMLVARVLVTRVGVRPLLVAGPLLAGTGFLLLSQLSVDGTYWPDLLPKLLLVSAGMGFMFVPLTLMVVSHVRDQDAGAASGVLNVGQQIGGSIGLAAIGTIAWTSVANSVQEHMAAGGAAAAGAAGAAAQSAGGVPTPILHQALTDGFSTGLMIAGFVTLSAFVVAIVTTWTPGRVRLSSAVQVDGAAPCDEALGTCEGAAA